MLEPATVYSQLSGHGVGLYTGVPDSLLKDFCAYVTDTVPADSHVIAANEGAAVGLAAGYHLATGGLALVYLQNSGVGNIVNPLLSLADPEVYSLPMILLIGWRGEPDVHDEPQHIKQGRVMLAMLDAMEVPYRVLSNEPEAAGEDIAFAAATAMERRCPFALVVRKGTFAPYKLRSSVDDDSPMSREEAIDRIVANLGPGDVVVSTTGMISRELFEIRRKRNDPAGCDFMTVGSMGHASSIAAGIAMRQPGRQVFCLDGDGAMIMHLGAVAVHGQTAPANFKHVVLNNGCHDSVGGQPTVARRVSLGKIAGACGYRVLDTVRGADALAAAVQCLRNTNGPALLEVLVRKGSRKDLGRPTSTPLDNKKAFMGGLGVDVG